MRNTTSVLAITLAASIAHAGGITTYTDRAGFNADTGSLTIEGFESEALGELALPTVFDSGLGVAMPSGSVSSYIGADDIHSFQNTTVMGRNYLAFGRTVHIPGAPSMPQTGSYSAEFSFESAVNAFGFDLSGAEFPDGANGFNVTTYNNGQIRDDFFFASDQIFTVEFYGIISGDSFDAIRINISVIGLNGIADYVAFDEVTWGVVPAPSAASLLALGGLIASRRRR